MLKISILFDYVMKYKFIICLAVLAVIVSSCSTNRSSSAIRMDNFVNNVAVSCDNYSEVQWEAVEKQYEALLAEVEKNYETMTPQERNMALEATGRYSALLLKYGLYSIAQETVVYLKGIEPLLKGFEKGLDEADGLDWDSLFDSLSDSAVEDGYADDEPDVYDHGIMDGDEYNDDDSDDVF